jgi:hypothetical protein
MPELEARAMITSQSHNLPSLDASEPAAADRNARTRPLAAAAWAAIERHGVLPTPRNFDLFFTYHDAARPGMGVPQARDADPPRDAGDPCLAGLAAGGDGSHAPRLTCRSKQAGAPADTGLVELAAQATQYALYGLLVVVIGLGFYFRWAQHDPLSFFGLFTVPAPYPFTKDQAGLIDSLHYWIATAIIILAGLHAYAVLFHNFVLRDDVLWRMLPGWHARRPEHGSPDPREAARELDSRI